MTDARPRAPSPEPAPSAPAPLSPLAAVAGTFTRPGATFSALVARPTWWLPLVTWLVVVLASVWVATPKIDMERSIREMFEKRMARTGQTMSDQQVREIAARSDRGPARAAAWAAPFTAGIFFLVALLLWGGARSFGAEARYPQLLAIWGHANLVNAAGAILSLPVLISLPDASETQLSVQRVFKSNVGAFLPETTPAALSSVASSLDVFSLAALALLCLGMTRLPQMPKGAAIGVPLALWLVYVAGKAGFAAVFLG